MGNADRIYAPADRLYRWPSPTRRQSNRGYHVSKNVSFASSVAPSMMETKQPKSLVGYYSKKPYESFGNNITDGDSPSHPIEIDSLPSSRITSQERDVEDATRVLTPEMSQNMLDTIDTAVGNPPVDTPTMLTHAMAQSQFQQLSPPLQSSVGVEPSEQMATEVSARPHRRSPRLSKKFNNYENMMARCTRHVNHRKRHDASKWYKVQAFIDSRITKDGQLQVLTSFTPVWLCLDDISGSGSKQEVEKLVEAKSGKEEWKKASQRWICHDLNTTVKLDYFE